MNTAVFTAPSPQLRGIDRAAAITPAFVARCHAIAAALTASGIAWQYVPSDRDTYDPPAGRLRRTADAFEMWIGAGHHDNRVTAHPCQVPMREAGREQPRLAPLKDFIPYGPERNAFKPDASIDLDRFVNAPVATIANELRRKVIAPCAVPYAAAMQRQDEAAAHAGGTEAAATALAAAYGGELHQGKNGYHKDSPCVYKIPHLGMIEVQGPDSFIVSRHTFSVSRRVLDAMLAAMSAEAAERDGAA